MYQSLFISRFDLRLISSILMSTILLFFADACGGGQAAAFDGLTDTPAERAAVIRGSAVTACGYLSTNNTNYVLMNDVESEGSCFFITAENVTLDLNDHTITYDNGAPLVITNGDFENDAGWDFSTAMNAQIVPGSYVKPVTVFSGNRSLRFAVPKMDQSVRSTVPLKLKPNTTYSLSAMFYNQSNDPVTSYVGIEGTNVKATQTGYTWRGFQYRNVTFTTDANPSPVTVTAGISGGTTGKSGYVYIDDIRIQRTKLAGVAVGPASWQGRNVVSDVTGFGNANYATIKNGKIVQGSGASDFSNCITVMENSGVGWKVNDLVLRARGANSKAIRSINAINAEISNNHIYNPQRVITSRDAFDGAAVKIEYPGYGNRIYRNVVHKGIQTAFYLPQTTGQPQNQIYDNNIELQSLYTNDFAIVAGGTAIHGNSINCGSGDNSCRGIAIGGTGTTVYNNIISVQQVPRNQEYNGCQAAGAYGMQMESSTHNINVYGNTVTANAGQCEAYAFRANPLAEKGGGSSDNIVHDNTFIAIANGTARAATIRYSAINRSDLKVFNNTFKTNHRWIFVDGGGAVVDPDFLNNHWETVAPLVMPFQPFEVFTWSDSHFNGTFVGNTYGNGDGELFEREVFRITGSMLPDTLSVFKVLP